MKHLSALLLILVIACNVYAQTPVVKSKTVYKSNGENYYIHIVKQGQTLYSIANAYDADLNNILQANNIINNTLSIGQKLKIPIINPINSESSKEPLFYYHTIANGETLYTIATKYNTSVENIFLFNPQSRYGIYIGQVLTIPNPRQGYVDQEDNSFFYHTVVSGETLFSISQKYGANIRQIQIFNPETKTGLNAGMLIKIPKNSYDLTEQLPVSKYSDDYNQDILEEEDPNSCNQFVYKKTYRFKVIMMLPLFIDQNLEALKNGIPSKNQNARTKFLDFYQGAMLAVNQLKYEGVSIEIHVFDTENNQAKVREMINDLDFSKFDLIIGPVYSKNFNIVAQKAKENKINIVSPLSVNSTKLINNPYAFQVMPSNETQIKKTSELISKFYDSTIVIIHSGTTQELQKINIYKDKLVKSFSNRPDINKISLKVLNYNVNGKSTIEDAFSVGNKNIVLIPNEKEVFVTQIIDQLFLFSKDYDITIIGSPNWELFQNINLEHLQRMNFNYASPLFIDYKYWKTMQFIKKYRTNFKTEPNKYAFQGYDITYYFLSALKNYGKNFQPCITNKTNLNYKKGIIFDFNFYRTNKFNGFENKGIHYLNYDKNYKLKETSIQ